MAVNKKSESVGVCLNSLGCKLNQAETEHIASQFTEAGYKIVAEVDEADVYILNTCTVTHIADRKSRHLLRMARRRNPDVLLVATGCYAQRAPQELAKIEGVHLVLDNDGKTRVVQLLEESGHLSSLAAVKEVSCTDNGSAFRTRAFVKVQDGCNSLCSYCIVPMVRGGERSVPIDCVIAEVEQWVTAGYKEVVLTGTKIGSYDYNGVNLKGLLERILAETDVKRVRLSSIQPQEVSPELIQLWRDQRLCCHFHLSLQSGSDEVLARMKRCYSVSDYQKSVALIRDMVPEAAITTDIIVGFPGESDAEFEQGYNLCRQMEFARIHVFPYSVRQGTQAAQMPYQIGDRVKKERSQRMLDLAEESAQNFSQRFLGQMMTVLFEQQSDGDWTGFTDNYIKLYTRSNEDLTNQLLPVKLMRISRGGVWGELVA